MRVLTRANAHTFTTRELVNEHMHSEIGRQQACGRARDKGMTLMDYLKVCEDEPSQTMTNEFNAKEFARGFFENETMWIRVCETILEMGWDGTDPQGEVRYKTPEELLSFVNEGAVVGYKYYNGMHPNVRSLAEMVIHTFLRWKSTR